ncbi:hypothetical protein LSAT2_012623, partial [Lamellibrachia satsuma]
VNKRVASLSRQPAPQTGRAIVVVRLPAPQTGRAIVIVRLPAPQTGRATAVLRPKITLAHERSTITTRRIFTTRPRLTRFRPSGACVDPRSVYQSTPERYRNWVT